MLARSGGVQNVVATLTSEHVTPTVVAAMRVLRSATKDAEVASQVLRCPNPNPNPNPTSSGSILRRAASHAITRPWHSSTPAVTCTQMGHTHRAVAGR